MSYYLILVLSLCGFSSCYSPYGYSFDNSKYCEDLSPHMVDIRDGDNINRQREINLDQVLGVWYGVEKIPHNQVEEYWRGRTTSECFYIDIKERNVQPTPPAPYGYGERSLGNHNSPAYGMTNIPYVNYGVGLSEPHRIRNFVLEWHEGLWQDDYHVKVNTSHRGFWPTDVPNGSVEKQYRFFGGVIQVLAVANNYLVLNFCMRLPHSQVFSAVLSRYENQLTPEDLAQIHNIFTIKRLSMSALKRVCYNSASISTLNSFLMLAFVIFLWNHNRQLC